jgi:exodeoxyribonuclease V beta subunit
MFTAFRADVPLDGVMLIEASAGTGKTWTITGLYVRLILERGLKVDEILVVTYTKAATAELRQRIRARLGEVALALKTGTGGDEFCRDLIEQTRLPALRENALRRLTHAISGFDEAAIYTIHGFCQRVLADSAFEAGAEFECELLADESEVLREIVDDYWRQTIGSGSGPWIEFLADAGQTPDVWLQEIKPHVGKPYVKVVECEVPPEAPEPELDAAAETELERSRAAFRQVYRSAQTSWRAAGQEVRALLLAHRGLNRGSYKPEQLVAWLDALDAFFGHAEWPCGLPEKFDKFTAESLEKGVRKGEPAPRHAFFRLCQALWASGQALKEATLRHEETKKERAARRRAFCEKRLAALKVRLLQYCNAELAKRKQARQRLSYNDLLNQLEQALLSERGERLAEAVRGRYRAALIDEFQDTDPVQYRIFSRIYYGSGFPVVMVGDPKQAIYSFRGADVFSYLAARRDAQALFTLDINQRSTPELIDAINALFASTRNPHPFVLDGIAYPAVRAAAKDRPLLRVDGDDRAALRFFLAPAKRNARGEPAQWTKGEATGMAVEATASEIARLLNLAAEGRARLAGGGADRPLGGGDIAVLVATHYQGRRVQEALSARRVPSVRQGQDNVFATAEASELERVLRAIAEPSRASLVKAALVTELIGLSGEAVAALSSEDAAWAPMLDRFQRYHGLWRDHGFIRMMRDWFAELGVAERLLRFQDGERRLTNLLHLSERLQVESRDRRGIDGLLGWFSRIIRTPGNEEEAALLRLESDADRVKIVTVHTSKGLEYPVVFCPFPWDGQLWRTGETAVCFHDFEDGGAQVLNFGSDALGQHRMLAGREKLAEKLRLLYVAVTRAKHRCYLFWGSIREMETAALSWLLHGPGEAVTDPLACMKRDKLDYAAVARGLQELAARAPAAIGIALPPETEARYRPRPSEPDALCAARFDRADLRPSWRMASFTALAGGRHGEAPGAEASDDDADRLPASTEGAADSMFGFPRGATPGICLHAIFEEWEFTERDRGRLAELVWRKLKAHGIDERWMPVVAGMVEATLDARLNADGLRLQAIPRERRVTEMEFTFAFQRLDLGQLQQALAAHGRDPSFAKRARELRFDALNGFMKGFIDLVVQDGELFYLVDYKSNWLGDSPGDYARPRLTEVIAREHYYLQYLIYCVALHRHLRLRLPGYDYARHFGGVYYLFLRGIGEGDHGIYHDRPRLALIEALDRSLSPASEAF